MFFPPTSQTQGLLSSSITNFSLDQHRFSRPMAAASSSPSITLIFGTPISDNCPMRRSKGFPFVRLGVRPRSKQQSRIEATIRVDSRRWISYFEDLWAWNSEKPKRVPEHLVIMVNGLVGSADDWRFAAEQFVKKLPDKVIVHRSECNSLALTFDGVDLMGQRLADEVIAVVNKRSGVQKISFVAHSLGGLIARYAIGKLYELVSMDSSVNGYHVNEEKRSEGRIAGLVPMNFITFATPHLGSRGHRQLPLLGGLPFLERSATEAAHLIVGRTGKHLFLTDSDEGRLPLLFRMVDDWDDVKFRSALGSFKRRVAYANANFDYMVGWRTSSIRRQHELPKYHLLAADEKYPHIIFEDKGNSKDDKNNEASSYVKTKTYDLEEAMIRGLTQVSWERVDVSFKQSHQRYIAHNTIQCFGCNLSMPSKRQQDIHSYSFAGYMINHMCKTVNYASSVIENQFNTSKQRLPECC